MKTIIYKCDVDKCFYNNLAGECKREEIEINENGNCGNIEISVKNKLYISRCQ